LGAATQLGKTLATHNLTLVYGGGKVGLMGAVAGYYDKLLEFFDGMVSAGFLGQNLREIVLEATTPKRLLEQLSSYTAAHVATESKVKL
jgi:predicted Rossmann-fold nucleotide-binding protein